MCFLLLVIESFSFLAGGLDKLGSRGKTRSKVNYLENMHTLQKPGFNYKCSRYIK